LAAVPICLALSACVSTVYPRPATVAAPGEFTWDAHLPLVQVDIIDAHGATGAGEPVTIDGPSVGMYDMTKTGGAGAPPVWAEGSLRLGVFPRCEVGTLVGILRQGGEIRCAVVKTDNPVSISVGGAAAYVPWFDIGGPWSRATLDVSRDFGTVVLMANLATSFGPEGRDLGTGVPVEHWDPPPDDTVSHDPGPTLMLVREEWRAAMALGVAISPEEASHAFVIGLVPHVVIDARPLQSARCNRCTSFVVDDLDRGFGFSLTVGVTHKVAD
jgi:hypothetical protein